MKSKMGLARFFLVAAVFVLGQNSASAQSTASGLAALPSNFQGDATDRAAGLKSWGSLLGSAVVFNQGGDASRGAYSLQSLVEKTQRQIILQAAGLAKGAEVASASGLSNTAKAPLQFSEERANENPLEKWTRVLAEEANEAAKKALGQAWSALSRVGKAAFGSFQSQPSSGAQTKTFHEGEETATKETELPPFLKSAELFDIGAPAVFSYGWDPITTSFAGVDVEVNVFNIAPCVVVIDAAGVKSAAQVENTLLKVEPMLLHVDPKGVNVEASLIEVAPKLINVAPFGAQLSIELPGHIHVEGTGIEVSPVGEENEVGPGANAEG
ncbi:g4627 [Coccomyxa elongata]